MEEDRQYLGIRIDGWNKRRIALCSISGMQFISPGYAKENYPDLWEEFEIHNPDWETRISKGDK